MKIKRYFAPTMREAIRLVRQEQGADAVILSNRPVSGGVEIVAAVDYDEALLNPQPEQVAAEAPLLDSPVAKVPSTRESGVAVDGKARARVLAERTLPESRPRAVAEPEAPRVPAPERVEWSQEPTLVEMRKEMKSLRGMLESQLSGLAWRELKEGQPVRADLLQRLMTLGLEVPLSKQIAAMVPSDADADHVWRQGLARLAAQLQVTGDDILTNGGVVALVGPTGVGKTTTVAKLAARFALRHGRRHVALVTTDSYRIGAHEQLRTYGRLLGITVHVASNRDELRSTLAELKDKKLVLIDTAGMSQRDMRLSEQTATLRGVGPVKSYLVLSAAAQTAALDQAARAFRKVELSGCIFTKLDEAATLGGALSVAIRHRLPVAYLGDGQRVPEDMHPARAHNLVNRGVMMMQENAQAMEEESLAMAYAGNVLHV
ncbi:flagellar biosynthesis protein FlhF [Endothiovibrio diazotrophicus]